MSAVAAETSFAPIHPARPRLRGWSSTRWETVAVAALVLVAILVRLPHFLTVPQYTDETWEVLWSLPIYYGEDYPLVNTNTFRGSVFNYILASAFYLLGPSAWVARLVVVVLGGLTIVPTYLLGKSFG